MASGRRQVRTNTRSLVYSSALTEAGEAYGVAVRRLIELCHHALSEHGAVVLEE